jgi:hypothetical protein
MTDTIRSTGRTVTASFTRPADVTAYASGDVVNDSTSAPTVLTFPRATKGSGEFSILQSATIITSANQATKPELQLFLFDSPVTPDNDNAVFTPTDDELATLLHIISFPASAFVVGDATSGAGGNAVCNAQELQLPINTLMSGNAIYGVPVMRAAYTPVSGEVFTIRLGLID